MPIGNCDLVLFCSATSITSVLADGSSSVAHPEEFLHLLFLLLGCFCFSEHGKFLLNQIECLSTEEEEEEEVHCTDCKAH